MSQERDSRARYRRRSIEHEEEKAWVGFYRSVGNAAIAAEVIQQLDSDPELKRAHLALYMRCKESLRIEEMRAARNKRIGQFVRMLCKMLFVAPVRRTRNALRHAADIAVECLPDSRAEPATRHVRHLSKESEFGRKFSAFGSDVGAQVNLHLNSESQSAKSPVTKTA